MKHDSVSQGRIAISMESDDHARVFWGTYLREAARQAAAQQAGENQAPNQEPEGGDLNGTNG